MKIKYVPVLVLFVFIVGGYGFAEEKKPPNILVIWGDDVGQTNISAYSHGIMGYQTPNIDRIADEGALFTDYYAQQSCTAGRAAFILGQCPFRTGLLSIGLPGSTHGIPNWAPTIADLLKEKGYATGQFGKNHLGDQDVHLPTNHGFDEFFGNLYHLNAEEEPETYYYPKEKEFHEKFGPRGVIKSTADGKIEDTGPLTRKRMETVDEELLAGSLDFIDRSHKAGKPFFVWHNATRMHVWTRLQEKYRGITGVSVFADGMTEHDTHIGKLLDKLDELGIAENTIVIYSTDNGAQKVAWPDGATNPFNGEKGTTNEGGFRAPIVCRWPGVIKPGTKINAIMSHEDWMPTLLAAAGESDIVSKLKKGHKANGKKWKIHPDGYNFLPYFSGEAKTGPRESFLYFSSSGELNAVRWRDWKLNFALEWGNQFSATRTTSALPEIVNLKADPYETAPKESGMYIRWMADNMWLIAPSGGVVAAFQASLSKYPFQNGMSNNPSKLTYDTVGLPTTK
ncbi:arylsulfatase [Desulfoluna spongiiphila]|uniref:arylsulfatase n=1 Tax=Desulfoluna spongiiphila TaxID=419481 RepID=UPI001252BE4A|nr:arylsulfatase [Desulfoluna spongiiphila]VVS91282.1 alkaline phosphatase-like alpha/beta/alpha [Desulfoluna spongiiphila]